LFALLGLHGDTISEQKEAEKNDELFKRYDTDGSGRMSKSEFVKFCRQTFNDSRKVIIKFMLQKDQWEREINLRRIPDRILDATFVVGILDDMPTPEAFQQGAKKLSITTNERKLSDYRYGIIMPAADRSLDAIFRQERPTLKEIKRYTKQLAEALGHLHAKSIMHGDIKLLNALRLDKRIRLIDMDSAALIGTQFAGAKFSSAMLPPEMFCILKQSEVKFFEEYWREESMKEGGTDLWKKIRPRKSLRGAVVVRTFRVKSDVVQPPSNTEEERIAAMIASVDDYDKLPYSLTVHTLKPCVLHSNLSAPPTYSLKLVPASEAIDSWSFGMLLFQLLSNKSMLQSNTDDDIGDEEAMWRAATWKDAQLSESIFAHITDNPLAVDLLHKLLVVDPSQRLTMKAAIHHPFFDAELSTGVASEKSMKEGMNEMKMAIFKEVEDMKTSILAVQKNQEKELHMLSALKQQQDMLMEKTIKLQELQEKTFNQLRSTEKVLLRGMFEASEVTVPTCFIIVNQLLEPPPPPASPSSVLLGEMAAAVGGVALAAGTVDAVDAIANEKVAKFDKFFRGLAQVGKSVVAAAHKVGEAGASLVSSTDEVIQGVSEAIKEWLPHGETLYFYLVDEYTMEPIIPRNPGEFGVYPIPIETQSPFIKKVLPLLKVTFKAISLLNAAAGLAHCLGLPFNSLMSGDSEAAIGDVIGAMDQRSSVAEFDCLQKMVDSVEESSAEDSSIPTSATESVRGGPLRELKRFFGEHDPDSTFCKLQRVVVENGYSCWTSPENAEKLRVEAESVMLPPPLKPQTFIPTHSTLESLQPLLEPSSSLALTLPHIVIETSIVDSPSAASAAYPPPSIHSNDAGECSLKQPEERLTLSSKSRKFLVPPDVKKGFGKKQARESMFFQSWTRRFFVLKAGKVLYYQDDSERSLKGELNLVGFLVDSSGGILRLLPSRYSSAKEKELVMEADRAADSESWEEALQAHIQFADEKLGGRN